MVDIDSLLTKTDAFLRTMHVVRDSFSLRPEKEHIGMCINYADLQEMRAQFVEELACTITTYVYAPDRQERLLLELMGEGRDKGAAMQKLLRRAKRKFRPSSLQGQFSELLLCNLLQHYFKAAPLVRKMPITTNPALERNGADAIHIARDGADYRLFIGEAKTYNRQTGGLRSALGDAVNDVVKKHYAHHTKELDLYIYEDFVPVELEQIAKDYINGALTNVEVHLVCIVTYDQKTPVTGTSRTAKLESVISALRADTAAVKCDTLLAGIAEELVPRLNYIVFPVQEMDKLIAAFQQELGA